MKNNPFSIVIIDEYNIDVHYDESLSEDSFNELKKSLSDKGFKHTSNVPPTHAKYYSMRSHDLQSHINKLVGEGKHEEAQHAGRILAARTQNISNRRDIARSKMQRFTMKSETLKVDSNGQWQINKNDGHMDLMCGELEKEETKGFKTPAGWSHRIQRGKTAQESSAIHFENPAHEGTVSIRLSPENNQFEVKHNGSFANFGGKKGTFDNPAAAIEHARGYLEALNTGSVIPKKLLNSSNPGVAALLPNTPKFAPASKPNVVPSATPIKPKV